MSCVQSGYLNFQVHLKVLNEKYTSLVPIDGQSYTYHCLKLLSYRASQYFFRNCFLIEILWELAPTKSTLCVNVRACVCVCVCVCVCACVGASLCERE